MSLKTKDKLKKQIVDMAKSVQRHQHELSELQVNNRQLAGINKAN